MLKKMVLASSVAAALLFSGCETMPSYNETQTITHLNLLQNQTWIATHIGNTAIQTAPTAHNIPSIQFDSATQRVSGADGCNRLMGSYTASKDALKLSQLAGTRMACMNNNNIDQKYNEALSKVTNYQVFGKTLKLLDSYGNVLLQYQSAIQPR